ncbi:DJ-1/PfpI family protein [Vibrio metschnikovii]|uniref:DJ-1/PfpI family protein n=1 Tax=bacterium 19CA03SA04 TaxID=2920698 RepID=A0AAU6SYU4_UNCXX|nr:DJ-1 family glyoxalase III [Vibrio metschnikovii]EKO3610768.1 DJ-1/PfpI family protein [Vibrio metschnikovii]EKO3613939.1 DJ-1/PfpI family protein [Vibrio metschnikovii]EKO3634953.1 DJ-1/PfpI family protein [Vibrio metschnikovii]EKO3648586.1 DJ-1/PfpI family protein [Vibrio metschnikovii]EKO3652228.1 DJ-1/PfpI family protein [Vibrio metschnikovii]
MTKRILVPIAPGTEEMEAITIIDILVRANYEVVVASADFSGQLTMKASRGVTLTADCKLVDVADEEFAAVVLPGGIGGAEVFRDSTLLVEIVKQQKYDGRLVAAICATPAVVLEHHQLYPKAIMTCHPSLQERIPEQRWRNRRVTFDVNHNLLTSQGPGTALEFAIEIIAQLSGKQRAKEVALPLIPLPQLHYDKQEEA